MFGVDWERRTFLGRALGALGGWIALTVPPESPLFKNPSEYGAPGDFHVNISEIKRIKHGWYIAKAWQCKECLRATIHGESSRPQSEVHLIREEILRNEVHQDGEVPSFQIKRLTLQIKSGQNGKLNEMTIYSLALHHPQYHIGINIGQHQVNTLAGMIGHRLPAPVVDIMIYRMDGVDLVEHLEAYITGIRELRNLHAGNNRAELAQLYKQIEEGLAITLMKTRETIREQIPLARNQLILTSMPESLKFVQLPSDLLPPRVQGCGCSCNCCCGCGLCCGCGCTLGLCAPPGICGCGCCSGCGCGCGCCCGCDLC